MTGPAEIVDAQVSVGEAPPLSMLDVDALLRGMDAAGVHRAALGPVGRWVAVDNAEGNQALADWAGKHPDRLVCWATANPWFGARAAAELRRAFDAGARGLKVVPALQGFGLLSPQFEPLLDVAEEHRRPVYVVTGTPVASEPLQLRELALRRPGITFVMGRSGRTDFSLDLLPALEGCSNIVAETAHNGAAVIADLVRRIGPDRVMFASDAPFNDVSLELDRVRRAGLGDAELPAVLAGTATTLFAGADVAGWVP